MVRPVFTKNHVFENSGKHKNRRPESLKVKIFQLPDPVVKAREISHKWAKFQKFSFGTGSRTADHIFQFSHFFLIFRKWITFSVWELEPRPKKKLPFIFDGLSGKMGLGSYRHMFCKSVQGVAHPYTERVLRHNVCKSWGTSREAISWINLQVSGMIRGGMKLLFRRFREFQYFVIRVAVASRLKGRNRPRGQKYHIL